MSRRIRNAWLIRAHRWLHQSVAPVQIQRSATLSQSRTRLSVLSLEDRWVPASFTVTNINDSGAGSLRQAITDLNASVDPTNTVTITATGTISLTSALDTITKNVSISGPSANTFAISRGTGAPGFRILTINNSQPSALVSISGVSIRGGSASGASNDGGGINVLAGDFSISQSVVSGNSATGVGGGIAFNGGKLNIQSSTISGNVALESQGGGGIHIYGTATTVANVSNSTITGNSSSGEGGGMTLLGLAVGTYPSYSPSTAVLNIRNTTISGNTASTGFTDPGDGGGGVCVSWYGYGGVLNIDSSIVSGNTHTKSGGHDDISADADSLVTINNAYYTDTSGFTSSGANNIIDTFANLKLGPLTDNGGPTPTRAITIGSLAIDKGSNISPALSFDQTGLTARALDGGSGSAVADIGAFELVPGVPGAGVGPLITVTVNNSTTNPYEFTVNYLDAVAMKGSTIGDATEITVTKIGGTPINATFVSATPSGNAPSVAATYKIIPPGGTWDTSDNGVYEVKILAGTVTNTNNIAVPASTLGSFTVSLPQTFTVTNTNDTGPGSLRQAILDSNANPSLDTIIFDPSFSSGTKTITLLSGQIALSDSVTINGPGADRLTIVAGTGARHFNADGPGTLNIIFNNLAFTGGNPTGSGGVILNTDETIAFDGVHAYGNKSTASGGIIVSSPGSSFIVRNSTLSGNSASGQGGVAYAYSYGKATTFIAENSTFSGNSAGVGGVFYGLSTSASTVIAIRNSTVVNNSATSGGVIRTTDNKATVTVSSSIVSGNIGGTSPNFLNPTVNADDSVISGTASGYTEGTITGGLPSTTTFNDLLLGALQANGGPVPTHNITSNLSPLIDLGNNNQGFLFDTRGGAPYVRVQGAKTDIGAVERIPGQPGAQPGGLVNVVANQSGVNNPYTFNITYSVEAGTNIDSSTVVNNSNAIRVTGPNGFNKLATFVSATPNTNASNIVATYKFNPGTNPGDPWLGAMNGVYTVAVEANQVKTAVSNAFVPSGVIGTFNVAIPLTLVVTNADDSGAGSLRQAILDSNASNLSADFITFDPTFFATNKTITLLASLPGISDALTITGPSSQAVTVSGAGAFRVLDTTPAATGSPIVISNLTLSGGSATGGAGLRMGDENVTLNSVTVTGNTSSGSGGGIYAISGGGSLTLNKTTVSANSASGSGGGIRWSSGTAGTFTINQSVISNNTTSTGGGGGGGIFSGSAKLTINQTTISGNTHTGASYGGGGIYFSGGGGTSLEIRNSTITGNSTSGIFNTVEGGGGGVYTFQAPTVYTIENTTISGNTAPWGGGISMATTTTLNVRNSTIAFNVATNALGGGGIFSSGDAGTVINLDSTAVGGNTAGGADDDVVANANTTVNATYSAFSTPYIPNGTNTNNIANPIASFQFGALANNGGPTQTHAIGTGSFLLNTGNPTQTLTTDQRGVGFARVVGSAADIGAFEIQAAAAPSVTGFIVNGGNAQRSRITQIELQFSGPVTAANFNTLGAIQLKRTAVASIPTGAVNDLVQTGPAAVNHITVAQGTANSLLLTFDNNGATNTTSNGVENGSLSDGYWQIIQGSFTSTLNDLNLRRLYGDSTSTTGGTVDGADLTAFGNTFNAASVAFDFNNDGVVDGSDLTAFGNRFGNVL